MTVLKDLEQSQANPFNFGTEPNIILHIDQWTIIPNMNKIGEGISEL